MLFTKAHPIFSNASPTFKRKQCQLSAVIRRLTKVRAVALIALLSLLPAARAQTGSYFHYEARHTHSIGLTPDGTRLLALNTPDAKLSVFDVTSSTNPEPVLVAEIAVGLEPVAVRARTNDEVWVVSELGDSVAVVSLSRGVVLDTLRVSDEPADVVFAQGKAFVSCARNSLIRVFDIATRTELAPISLLGNSPRALTTNAAGTKVYVAFLLSGNGTTILPAAQAPVQPAPTNPDLPAAPKTGLIVAAGDARIPYTVLDNDVAEIDAQTGTITRYLTSGGTNLFDIAVHPQSGDIWVANTEARNVIRFEPSLRGHVLDHRLTRFAQVSGTPTVYDLNPGFNYFVFPYPTGKATSLAQPTGVVLSSDGTSAWLAAFASDRVAKIDTATGSILTRTDIRPASAGPREMRGPRAMALLESRQRLYVLNKLSNTISILSTANSAILTEIPVGTYDPMPTAIKQGRGFLFDARQSGNGTISCGSCHIDADVDGLAWDLGDRGGTLVTLTGKNLSLHDETLRTRLLHPMKGPMVTQTLRGTQNGAPFHWRGDKPTLQSFNTTFDKLMGGVQLPAADIDAMVAYQLTLKHHPNPNLQPDGSFPATVEGGSPINGKILFQQERLHCATCHSLPPGISPDPSLPILPSPDNNIDLVSPLGATQSVKNPSLATTYQRLGFNPAAGQVSRKGFGMLHDGVGANLPLGHPYTLAQFNTVDEVADLKAFMLCFNTGTAPAVGASRTVTSSNAGSSPVIADIALYESQAVGGAVELVVKGAVAGAQQSFLYKPATQLYEPNSVGGTPLTRAALLALLGSNNAITFSAVPPGYGQRLGKDRDGNGTLDQDEPRPGLQFGPAPTSGVRLSWPTTPNGWLLESTSDLTAGWSAITSPRTLNGGSYLIDETTSGLPARYYRLRRSW